MAFNWKNLFSGALTGAGAGSFAGPAGMIGGALIGGLGGAVPKIGNVVNPIMKVGQTASMFSSPLQSKMGATSSYANPFSGFPGGGSVPGFSNAISSVSQPASTLNKSGGGLNFLKGLFGEKPNKALLAGLGLAGASQLIRSPKVPNNPQSVIDYQNMVNSGGSALNQQAQGALSTELSRPFEQVSQEEQDAVLRELERNQKNEEDQIRDLYRNLRPGTDPSTDSAFRRDIGEMNDRYAKTKADTLAQLRRQVSNDFQANRIRQVLAAQGIDAQNMQQRLQAANFDVDRMIDQLNISYQDRKTLRDFLLGTGGQIAVGQLTPPALSLFGNQNTVGVK